MAAIHLQRPMIIRRLAPAASCRLLSTAAARKRGDLDFNGLASARDVYLKGKRDVMPPPGWDANLVDRVVTSTAADVMNRPCVVSPKPDEMVHYVTDQDSVQESADVFWKKRIGALMVKSKADGSLVGILSERDFVKALATDTTKTSQVKDLMTPLSRMITVSVTTSVGECMELMRKVASRALSASRLSSPRLSSHLTSPPRLSPPRPRLTPLVCLASASRLPLSPSLAYVAAAPPLRLPL